MNLNRKRTTGLAITLAATLSACAPTPTATPGDSAGTQARSGAIERHLAAMGTSLTVMAEAETRAVALSQSELAVRAVEAVEARLSTWRDDSELAKLNAAAIDTPIQLSEPLAADLLRAQEIWADTNGNFDPALGALVMTWDLRGQGRVPSEADRAIAIQSSGWPHYSLVEGSLTRKHAAAQLEEGGFGKGVALDAALAATDAAALSSFALELGGQWIVRHQDEAPFTIGIAHPEHRQQSLLELQMTSGSAATSGNSERGLMLDGKRYGHILNSTTGMPAHDFGSMTVVAEDAITADCLSTALFVMGPDAALAWAAERNSIEVVVVESTDSGPRVRATAGLKARLTPHSPELNVEFVSRETERAGQ